MFCSCTSYPYALRINSENSSEIETLLLVLELCLSFYPVFKIKKSMNVCFTSLCDDIGCFSDRDMTTQIPKESLTKVMATFTLAA